MRFSRKKFDNAYDRCWVSVPKSDRTYKNGIAEHETDYIKLTLTSSGKYKAEDIDSVPDELCKITRSLDNKAVKAYLKLNGKLPEGVESTGYILRKSLKG